MRALVARDLADASLAGLSADRRFATAYNAALQAANMAIACAGYRIVSKVGHQRISLGARNWPSGEAAHSTPTILRRVDGSEILSTTRSPMLRQTQKQKEIVVQAKQFYVEVEDWIAKNHPAMKM